MFVGPPCGTVLLHPQHVGPLTSGLLQSRLRVRTVGQFIAAGRHPAWTSPLHRPELHRLCKDVSDIYQRCGTGWPRRCAGEPDLHSPFQKLIADACFPIASAS